MKSKSVRLAGLRDPRIQGILLGSLLLLGTAFLLVSCEARSRSVRTMQTLGHGWTSAPGLLSELPQDGALESADAPLISPLMPARHGQEARTYFYRLPTQAGQTFVLSLPGLRQFHFLQIGPKVFHAEERQTGLSLFQFEATGPETLLILQSSPGMARLEDPGLIPRPALFGPAEDFEALERLSAGLSILQAGFLLLGGLFLALLYLFWPKNRDFLALAIFMVAAAAFSFVRSGGYFGLLELPRTLGSALYLLGSAGLAITFPYLLSWAFPGRIPKGLRLALFIVPSVLALATGVLVFLPEAESWLALGFTAWLALGSLATIAWLVLLIIKGDIRARWFLPAFAFMVVALSLCRVFPTSSISALYLGPAGIVVFTFVSMLMLVKKVGDSFEAAEVLTDYVANVSTTMKRFIPKEFLECLNKDDVVDLRLGDHVKKKMTIFFSDIRAFTELSEKLTVEENFAFINSYLSRMVPIVTGNGGFVDKYIGDGIMALFAGDGGPDAAIRAAISMQEKMVEYNGHRAKMGYRSLGMGVGVHTGDLMLGVIGVDDRMENTVISDAVNLSSRLQAITKSFNISLAISEQAFKELADPGVYKYRFIGKVKVKGKAAPVSVFEIFDGIAPDLFERKMKANTYFEQGMLAYYQKDFGGAMYYFKRVLEIIPEDGASAFYLDNCMNKASF